MWHGHDCLVNRMRRLQVGAMNYRNKMHLLQAVKKNLNPFPVRDFQNRWVNTDAPCSEFLIQSTAIGKTLRNRRTRKDNSRSIFDSTLPSWLWKLLFIITINIFMKSTMVGNAQNTSNVVITDSSDSREETLRNHTSWFLFARGHP